MKVQPLKLPLLRSLGLMQFVIQAIAAPLQFHPRYSSEALPFLFRSSPFQTSGVSATSSAGVFVALP